jgi:hypothetical protein
VPTLDATAITAAEGDLAPAWFIYLDISGDPLRVTTFGQDVAFTGTGDADLDGHTFVAFGGQLLTVGDISNSDSGSDTLSITLSGIVDMDTTLINDIGDRTLWQGRTARIWMLAYDVTGTTPQGGIAPFYTGYMSKVGIIAAPSGQAIQLSVENWLAAFNSASNRSYLNQKDYDSSDTSAAATMAAANGLRRDTGAGGGSSTPTPGGTYTNTDPGLINDIGGTNIGRNTYGGGTIGFQ